MKKNIQLKLGEIKTIFINPYYTCNNNCTYCAIGDTLQLPNKINLDSLNFITNRLFMFLESIQSEIADDCLFIFLGGEPLLAWNSWLIPTIQKLHNLNQNYQFRLSTNGVLLTSNKYNDIDKYQININFSLDGPKEVHNLNRKLLSGAGSFDIVYNNFLKIPNSLSMLLHPCSTIHTNTVQYLSKTFQFMIDTYEKRKFNFYTMNQTDGFQWLPEHFQYFETEFYKIKDLLPQAKFNYNFIPNPPFTENLLFGLTSGEIAVKSNELTHPIKESMIGNLLDEDMLNEDNLTYYRNFHLNKKNKRVLPKTELCNICPGKNYYCIQKDKSFFATEQTYIDLVNFCQHNFILNKVFNGGYYNDNT